MTRFEPYYAKYMKREKTDRFGIAHLLQILVIFAGIMLILSRLNSIELQSSHISWDDSQLTVQEPRGGETYTLPYSEIESMELASITDFGSWVRGMDTDHTRYGLWHNDEFGDYHLYVQKSIPISIIMKTADGYTVLNLESEDVTQQLFEQISSYLKISNLKI